MHNLVPPVYRSKKRKKVQNAATEMIPGLKEMLDIEKLKTLCCLAYHKGDWKVI